MEYKYIDAGALIMHLSDYALAKSPNDNDDADIRFMDKLVYEAINNCIAVAEEIPAANVEPRKYDGDYIRKGDVINLIQSKCESPLPVCNDSDYMISAPALANEIDDLPTAGVELVRHGHWEEKQYPQPLSDGSKTKYYATCCGTTWDAKSNRCPHCEFKIIR